MERPSIKEGARRGEPKHARLSTLRDVHIIAQEQDDKANFLRQAFFPKPTPGQTGQHKPKLRKPSPNPLSHHKIWLTVRCTATRTALGPDGIPSELLKMLITKQPHASSSPFMAALAEVFSASFDLRYEFSHFRASTTMPLPKPGKSHMTRNVNRSMSHPITSTSGVEWATRFERCFIRLLGWQKAGKAENMF